jgi:hypothetical protein
MGHAQTEAQDSVTYESLFKWVERKLTYDYFDPSNQHWWVNQFQPNLDGSVVIKNIAAQHPKRVMEKVYHLRQCFLYDLNPNRVSVIETPTDQGRFVKGKIIRLEGFGDEKKIVTQKDGVHGSNVSFIHVSVPAFLEDSLKDYAGELKTGLSKLIFMSARLFNQNNDAKNKEAVFSALRGSYVSKDSSAYLSFEVVDPGHVRFEWTQGKERSYGQIGFDATKKVYFLFKSSPEKYMLREFTVDTTVADLVLISGQDSVNIVGRNTLEFVLDGKRQRFSRY